MLKYIWPENEMKVTASDGTVVWTAYDYGKYRCSWEIHYNNRSSNTKYNMTAEQIWEWNHLYWVPHSEQTNFDLKYHALMKLIIIKLMS